MTESEDGAGVNLEPETVRRMREVFGGRACVTCGAPAARMFGGRFFCARHHRPERASDSLPRVYRWPDFRSG